MLYQQLHGLSLPEMPEVAVPLAPVVQSPVTSTPGLRAPARVLRPDGRGGFALMPVHGVEQDLIAWRLYLSGALSGGL